MRRPWRQRRAIEPRLMASIRAMELQMAKEILAEVFHTWTGEVEDSYFFQPSLRDSISTKRSSSNQQCSPRRYKESVRALQYGLWAGT